MTPLCKPKLLAYDAGNQIFNRSLPMRFILMFAMFFAPIAFAQDGGNGRGRGPDRDRDEDKTELVCEVEQGGVQAEMEFEVKEKKGTVEKEFKAKLKAGLDDGFNAGDIVTVTVDNVAVGEIVLQAKKRKLEGEIKQKQEGVFLDDFPEIVEGTIGTFNGLTCVFVL